MIPSEKHIHILGLGNLGRFFAHSLQVADCTAPISLIFHRPGLFEEWESASRQISITTKESSNNKSKNIKNHGDSGGKPQGTYTSKSSTYIIESIHASPTTSNSLLEQSNEKKDEYMSPILNLIVTTKSHKTLEALRSVKNRLSEKSTILFVQNGLGTVSKVNESLFPDPVTRPSYLTAIVSHGLFSIGPFHSVHAGLGGVTFGRIPSFSSSSPQPCSESSLNSSSALVERILGSSSLNAMYFDYWDLRNIQLEKLVINAIINPLSALFYCPNGQIFWIGIIREPLLKLVRRLIQEIHQVFLQLDPPEGPVDPDRFCPSNMELMASCTARRTRDNLSSMLQDILKERETEIDSINGWIVAEGEKRGIDVRCNKKVIELVKSGVKLHDDDIEYHFPGTFSREEMNGWNQALENLGKNGIKRSKEVLFNKYGTCVLAW
ncbi:putative 2-dehydropantoate 2-reductase [Golovinomyces cichoracearum]|uniref:2-dehydropantoate 2-reductase n=1 Tax=Golovinomyces cichoracearum TaxID=62708 RepID=A0A420IKZ3_9PEZI|nr:putative 2-dehydropantoate 2-reductase [Golovinomyces cichoracearum]